MNNTFEDISGKEHWYSISSIMHPSMNSSLDGVSVDIFFCGCDIICKGCHNKMLQTFTEPTVSMERVIGALKKAEKRFTVINLMGGEPTCVRLDKLLYFIEQLRHSFPDKKVCMFTGRELNEVAPELLSVLDYVKTGRYDEENLTPIGSFLASKNQKMWKKNEHGLWKQQWPEI